MNLLVSQPLLEWLEASYRYAEVKNLLYSQTPSYSGNQSLKDKGFDIKIRLLKETSSFPSLAVGKRILLEQEDFLQSTS